jgi:hypothetical protein
MPKLKYRFRNTGRVLFRDAWQFWVTILVLIVLVLLPHVTWADSETWRRRSGILLQFAGLVTVAVGIYQTRRLFGREPVSVGLKRWLTNLKSAWLMPPHRLSGHGGTFRVIGTGSMTLTGHAPTLISTMEDRVKAVEAEVNALQKRLTQFMADSTKRNEEIQKAVPEEGANRERGEKAVRLLIEEQAAGGLHLEIMGLVWLLAGTVIVW